MDTKAFNQCKRSSFRRSIRHQQIQIIHKPIRNRQLQPKNPIKSLSELKHKILSQNYNVKQFTQDLQFIEANIRSKQFADKVEKQCIIETILIVIIDSLDPWTIKSQHRQEITSSKISQENQYLRKNCMWPEASPSQTQNVFFFEETTKEMDIDGLSESEAEVQEFGQLLVSSSLQQDRKLWLMVGYKFVGLLGLILDIGLHQCSHLVVRPYCNSALILDRFSFMFSNITDTIEGMVLDLINFDEKRKLEQENIQEARKILSLEPQRMHIIMKIMSLLSKIGQISHFDKSHWEVLLVLYEDFWSSKNLHERPQYSKMKRIKELFAVLIKSCECQFILEDNQINQSLVKLQKILAASISFRLKELCLEISYRMVEIGEFLKVDFELLTGILRKQDFLEKDLLDELKKILCCLLNLTSQIYREEIQFGGFIESFEIHEESLDYRETSILKICRFYSERTIEILNEQLELSEEEILRICEEHQWVRPYIEKKLELDIKETP